MKIILNITLMQNTEKQVWIGGKIFVALVLKESFLFFLTNIGGFPNFLD